MASCLPADKEKVGVIMCTKNMKASDWLRSYKEVKKMQWKLCSIKNNKMCVLISGLIFFQVVLFQPSVLLMILTATVSISM